MRIEYDVPVYDFFIHENGILEEHWEEVANNKDRIVLDPDVKRYNELQKLGVLRNIVLYEEERMVGYSVIFIQPHLHYQQDIYAFVDVLFVDPMFRNSRAGIQLINETEKLCRELKISVLQYHTKPNHNTIEKILYKKGYFHMENIIGKTLKEV